MKPFPDVDSFVRWIMENCHYCRFFCDDPQVPPPDPCNMPHNLMMAQNGGEPIPELHLRSYNFVPVTDPHRPHWMGPKKCPQKKDRRGR